MPVTYAFEGHILMIKCLGRYGRDELRSAWDMAMQDPNCPEKMEFVLDVRESASLASRSTEDLRGTTIWFAGQAARINNRCALLTRTGLQYGMMRIASAWADFKGIEARVFTDRARALAWLASFRVDGDAIRCRLQ